MNKTFKNICEIQEEYFPSDTVMIVTEEERKYIEEIRKSKPCVGFITWFCDGCHEQMSGFPKISKKGNKYCSKCYNKLEE